MRLVAENRYLPVREARAGESQAWDALFKRYQLPLYVYVFELVHHEQETLDILQETFINAIRHIGTLQSDEKFGSWLFSIAHQKCVQFWRKQARRELFIESDPPGFVEEAEFLQEANDPRDLLIRKEQEEQFMQQVAQLPLPHRSVLLLYFVEEFSLEEIAGLTETQLGTVKSRMHYAKRALKKLIEESNEKTP
jgi:RNA polymerase sigma-70 factor, ECF subfamily